MEYIFLSFLYMRMSTSYPNDYGFPRTAFQIILNMSRIFLIVEFPELDVAQPGDLQMETHVISPSLI